MLTLLTPRQPPFAMNAYRVLIPTVVLLSSLLAKSSSAQALYFADGQNGTISKATLAGEISTYATVTSPRGSNITGLTMDQSGNLYVALNGDIGGTGPGQSGPNPEPIYKIATDGTISQIAVVESPISLTTDQSGNLYVSSYGYGVISKISQTGVVTTFATGLVGGIRGMKFNQNGNLFFTNGSLYQVTPGGVVSQFAPYNQLERDLAFDSSGNLYTVSRTNANGGNYIVKYSSSGESSTFVSATNTPAYAYGLAMDGSDNLYVTSTEIVVGFGLGRISKITPDGTVSTFASGLNVPRYIVYAPGVSAAAPEPATLVLLLSAGATVAVRRGCRRKVRR